MSVLESIAFAAAQSDESSPQHDDSYRASRQQQYFIYRLRLSAYDIFLGRVNDSFDI